LDHQHSQKSSRTTALKSLIKKPGLMPRLIAFTQRSIVFLNFGEADWPTLKRGLALLTHSYPDSSEWASRYLVVAYTMKDLEATKDALDTLKGNYSPDYSPRVIPDPTFYQAASEWVENQLGQGPLPKGIPQHYA
jgi:hypothetical protein